MASDLLFVACSTLASSEASPAMKGAATEALLSAASSGLPLPPTTARLIWSHWRSAPCNRSWRHATNLGDIPDAVVRAEAVAILEGGDAGEDERDLATDVLVGKAHASHLEDRFILGLVERVRSGERAREAVRVVEAVHGARGLAIEVLRMVRDRWVASQVAGVREAAVSIAALIVEPDMVFVERALADPDVEVRTAIAYALDGDFPGRELAVGLVEARLRLEVHPQGRASLMRAQAALVEDGHRSRRRGR